MTVDAVWPGQTFPLGASWDGAGTNFSLFSEHAERVELCLFDGDDSEQRVELTVVTPARGARELSRGSRAVASVALALGLVAAAAVYTLVSLLAAARRR